MCWGEGWYATAPAVRNVTRGHQAHTIRAGSKAGNVGDIKTTPLRASCVVSSVPCDTGQGVCLKR